MRLKLLFVLMLFSLSYTMTDLQFSKDTATIGEEIVLSGKFTNPGDTVDSRIFIDRNADGIFTEGTDLLVFDSKEDKEPFIDGAGFMDDQKDGLLEMKFIAGGDGPFSIEGNYIWIFDDKGTLTTLKITILAPVNPTHYISGTVSSPDGPIKDLLIWGQLEMDGPDSEGINHVSAITKADGTYLLILPPEWKGKKIRIGTWDDFDVLLGKGYLPPPHAVLLFDKDVLTHNFVFTQATQFVKLFVIDEANKALPDLGIDIWLESDSGGGEESIFGETDVNGMVILPVKTGKWGIGVESHDPGDMKFLVPYLKLEITETTDTLVDTFKVHTTNGSVFVKVDNQTSIDIKEHMIGFNLSVKPAGSEVELYSYFNYRGEMFFELAASTLLQDYQFHHWVNMGELDGYMISAVPNSGIKVGDTVVVTIKEKINEHLISGKAIDENGTPLPNVSLSFFEENSQQGGVQLVTDLNGYFEAKVYPGKWRIMYNPAPNSPTYMVPEIVVDIFESSGTVTVDYKMVTATEKITVHLLNKSGVILEQYTYGVDIYHDMGDMMKLISIPDMIDDTTLVFPVSSMFNSYKLHSWLDNNKYPNIFISPRDKDSIKAGEIVLVEIAKPNQILKVIATNESNIPVTNADVIVWSTGEGEDHIEFKGLLDGSGIANIPIIPGEWEVHVATETLMNKHHKISVTSGVDTTTFNYVLKTPNAQISGKLVNISKYPLTELKELGVGAEAHPPLDSMQKDSMAEGPMDNYYMRVKVKADGSFILPVLATDGVLIDGYYVGIDDWNLPHDAAIAPSSKGFMFYPYMNVQPGNDSLYFALFNIEGFLYGTVELKILDSLMNEFNKTRQAMMMGAVITVKEKSTGFVNTAEIMMDGKYEMPLPKGNFEVTLTIYAPDTTITHSIPSLIMDGGNTEVRFTDDGIIITAVLKTQQKSNFHFAAKTIDNMPVITFTVPEVSDVHIALLDLRGRILAEKSLSNLHSGEYSAEFANLNLASGFYISRIKVLNKQGFVKYLKFVIR